MPCLLNCLSWLDTVKDLILLVVGHYGVGVWAQGQGEGGLIRNPVFNQPVFPRARPIESPQRKGPDTSAEDKPNSQPTQGNSWRPPQTKTCLSPFPAQTHPDVNDFQEAPTYTQSYKIRRDTIPSQPAASKAPSNLSPGARFAFKDKPAHLNSRQELSRRNSA